MLIGFIQNIDQENQYLSQYQKIQKTRNYNFIKKLNLLNWQILYYKNQDYKSSINLY